MVHLCNIKMSAVTTRNSHKSKVKQYDIDGFISQLLASSKFDDLAEKLAEKAASKIMHKDAAPAPIETATDDNKVDNSTESTQEVNQNQLNGDYEKAYENKKFNNMKLRKDFTGRINPQAVMNGTILLTENLQLKYKHLKKKALEKKVNSVQDRLPKNDTKEDPFKHNKTTGLADFKDHNNKTEERIENQNATETSQNDTIKESIDENKRSRDGTKDDDRKQDLNRNSELNESFHSDTDSETSDKSKNPDHSLEEQGPRHEQTIFREGQNSEPQDKSIEKHEASHVDNIIREGKVSSLDEEYQKHLTRSKEKSIEEVENTEGEPEKGRNEEINVDENVTAQFRAREDSIEDNKVTSDNNPYGGVYRSKVSDESDDHSEERSPKDQSSQEQTGEEVNSSELKPVIRKEGNKLYTYIRAPEYDEYHEMLAKWQKEHHENPADFMT